MNVTQIDGIVLTDKLKEKLKFFQNSETGSIYLDKLDDIMDNTINMNNDNPQIKLDYIIVLRDIYKLVRYIYEARKEVGNE